MVSTSYRAHVGPNEEVKQTEQTSPNHITIREVDDSDSEIELAKTLETLENGGQARGNELKGLNRRTAEELCPIYVTSLL